MDDFNQRQISLVHEFIERYRHNEFSLNVLVQRLEGLRNVITIGELKSRLEPILWELEGVNACSLENSEGILETQQITTVEAKLAKLAELTNAFLHADD